MSSNYLFLCHPLLLLPSVFPNESFPMSRLFAPGGQSIGPSASTSVLWMNIQGWFPLGLTGLISLLSKGLLREFFSTTVYKHQFFNTQPSLWSSSHIQYDYWKTIALTIWTFVGEVISLLFIYLFILEENGFFFNYLFYLEANYVTILYWFCHHQHESAMGVHILPFLNSPSHLPPHTIPLGHANAPAPSILYHASNLDGRFV